MKRFFKSNVLIWVYFALVCLIELLAVVVTSGKFYIRQPWIFLLIQFTIMFILLSIPSNKARHITTYILLIAFMVINLFFIILYEMTETIFDFGMFNLRNDGMAILESVPINFTFFSITMLSISAYIVFGGRYARKAEKPVSIKWYALPCSVAMVLGLAAVLFFNNRGFQEDVTAKLYRKSEASYCEYGAVGNFVNEVVKGSFFSKIELGDEQQLEDFIYDKNSIYYTNFATEEEYNVVTILVESFEWTAFVQNLDLYVNGHNIDYSRYTDSNGNKFTSAEQVLRELYPNLYAFYDSSIVMTNFYSREKTDISENISFLGSYPTNAYVNYDFGENNMATTMANVLKGLDNDITANAFHNGSYDYYNRNIELISAGFDSFRATDQMAEMGMPNWKAKGERNLDKDMIKTCADQMFPTDRRFYTYITTITMHGQYTYRKNLEERGYYDKLNKFGITESSGTSFNDINHNNFYYYCACVMEYDAALGEIMNQLNTRTNSEGEKLIDNTILLMFGDHNTYYSSLSNYVKGIDDTTASNHNDLFRVPCMVYYPKMSDIVSYLNTTLLQEFVDDYTRKFSNTMSANEILNKAKEQLNSRYVVTNTDKGTQILVKKFMCTADILPTLFDLCGINVYGNLYFGHSAFDKTESVLYSRAYDMFITDSLYFVSLNNIKYSRHEVLNDEPALKYADLYDYSYDDHIREVEIECKILLEKLNVCNRIFYNDYFARDNINNKSKTNKQIFVEKLIEINKKGA